MAGSAFLWDTCVLYRWLNGTPDDFVDHIQKFLEDSASGKTEIFISTIALAEIRASNVNRQGLTPMQVLNSMPGSFHYVDTSPDIMSLAGYLRDQRFRNSDGPENRASTRFLGTGDAIHLATGVALREEFGVQNLTLHTFDEGKKKNSDEDTKGVPIIGFERWCRDCADDEEIQKVISMPRTKPAHPLCKLP